MTQLQYPAWILGIATLVLTNGCKKSSSSSAGSGSEGQNNRSRLNRSSTRTVRSVMLYPVDSRRRRQGSRERPRSDVRRQRSAHTVDWLAEHIRNPKTHKPESRMPSFDGKLQPSEISRVSRVSIGKKG